MWKEGSSDLASARRGAFVSFCQTRSFCQFLTVTSGREGIIFPCDGSQTRSSRGHCSMAC